MLGGEPCQGLVPEAGELGDRGVCPGGAFFQPGDLFLETGDLGGAGVGSFAGIEEFTEPLLELGAQVGVGAASVKSGAIDVGRRSESLDVTFPAGREVAAEQPGYGGPDLGLVVGELLPAEPHAGSPAASSIRSRTRTARSYSVCRRARSVFWARPSWPRNVLVFSACCSQTGRWQGWCVACGQRAESHIPMSGLSPAWSPASLRQSARDGSVNQQ